MEYSKAPRAFGGDLPKNTSFDNFEVEHDFPHLGKRIMLLNARLIPEPPAKPRIMLLAIEDITERKQVEQIANDAREYAESIVETLREPLIVLDADLKVVSANRTFYQTFKTKPEETEGKLVYDIGNQQWNIPKLRELLEEILPKNTSFDNFEVEHDFPHLGKRIMLLNARLIPQPPAKPRIILLAIEDITERKRVEQIANDAREYAESIVETLREPLIVLDADLKVVSANRTFYQTFKTKPEETEGKLLYDIGDRQWDIPKLQELLEKILPQNTHFQRLRNGTRLPHHRATDNATERPTDLQRGKQNTDDSAGHRGHHRPQAGGGSAERFGGPVSSAL